ncbi:MAG: hypothetical protein KKA05_03805, partial [Alphaproteobacteria bacterium]|nr:hypothetical protein [Alphaproteobacteria bacterium]
EGRKILATYKLIPQRDVDNVLASNVRFQQERDNAIATTRGVQQQLKISEEHRQRLRGDISDQQNTIMELGKKINDLDTEKDELNKTIEVMKNIRPPNPLIYVGAGVLAGVFAATVALKLMTGAAEEAPPPRIEPVSTEMPVLNMPPPINQRRPI